MTATVYLAWQGNVQVEVKWRIVTTLDELQLCLNDGYFPSELQAREAFAAATVPIHRVPDPETEIALVDEAAMALAVPADDEPPFVEHLDADEPASEPKRTARKKR